MLAYSGADGDGDGNIDQDDLAVWQAHFGETLGVGAGAGSAAASEPAGGVVAGEDQALVARERALAGFGAAASVGRVPRTEYGVHRTSNGATSRRTFGSQSQLDTLLLSVADSPADDAANSESAPACQRNGHETSQQATAIDGALAELDQTVRWRGRSLALPAWYGRI